MSFTKVEYRGLEVGKVGISSAGGLIGVGATMLNFVGAGNTFAVSADGTTVDISIAGGGGSGSSHYHATWEKIAKEANRRFKAIEKSIRKAVSRTSDKSSKK